MTDEIGIVYTTTDGRKHDSHEAARDWQATVTHVDAFLASQGVSDTARGTKRRLLLAFVDWSPPAEEGSEGP